MRVPIAGSFVERETGRHVSIPVRGKPRVAYSPDGRHNVTGGYGHVAARNQTTRAWTIESPR